MAPCTADGETWLIRSALTSMMPSRLSMASVSSLRARASVAARSLHALTVCRWPGRTW
ncbi:MAG: hypothetical protein NTX87_18920 [Planctomycetota bacterium]|nr:hypothetical protein [Planctomycetota bacterium]